MTQPDQLEPIGAANYDSLAAWAAKTQEDWEAEIHADHEAHFVDVEDGWAGLLTAVDKFWRGVIEYNLNVLVNPLLETADALEDNEDWSWDASVRHTPVGGSATVLGDGVVHELGSDPILPVAPGQNINAWTWVRWRDVVCDGAAFELVLFRYDGTNPATAVVIGQEVLESFTDPVEDSAEFFQNDFIKLDGNYTIADETTKGVRLVWRQTENVTAGQSWWHDASMTKANDDFTRKMQNIDLDGNFDLSKVFNQLPAENVTGVGGTPNIGLSVTETITRMWESWFSTPVPDTDIDRVAETFDAIRAAVAGGFTLQTFTASDASWDVPPELAAATEAYAGAIGGGGKGLVGLLSDYGTDRGGDGGSTGGYINNAFDPSTSGATLAVTVGAAATTAGSNGGITSIVNGATTLVASVPGTGAISSLQGYVPASQPGRGGKGGGVTDSFTVAPSWTGASGENSPTAIGGAGGTGTSDGAFNTTGNPGADGANGNYTIIPISGGAGGGGGGGAHSGGFATATGGTGGDGGFPGGGSGGGGAAVGFGDVGGLPGVPGNGLAYLLWK